VPPLAVSDAFDSMGIKPGRLTATAAGVAESAGGAALALGYQTPLASAALISVMLTATNRVHLKNGPWITNGGYEYNVVMIAAATALAEAGPGVLSLDALRGKQREGALWGLVALGLGAAGAAGAHFLIEQQAAKEIGSPAHNGAAGGPAASGQAHDESAHPVNGAGAPAPVETAVEPEPAEDLGGDVETES